MDWIEVASWYGQQPEGFHCGLQKSIYSNNYYASPLTIGASCIIIFCNKAFKLSLEPKATRSIGSQLKFGCWVVMVKARAESWHGHLHILKDSLREHILLNLHIGLVSVTGKSLCSYALRLSPKYIHKYLSK